MTDLETVVDRYLAGEASSQDLVDCREARKKELQAYHEWCKQQDRLYYKLALAFVVFWCVFVIVLGLM